MAVRPRRPVAIATAALAAAAGPAAWNAILNTVHAPEFFTDAPIPVFPISWQDTGSGVFTLALAAAPGRLVALTALLAGKADQFDHLGGVDHGDQGGAGGAAAMGSEGIRRGQAEAEPGLDGRSGLGAGLDDLAQRESGGLHGSGGDHPGDRHDLLRCAGDDPGR